MSIFRNKDTVEEFWDNSILAQVSSTAKDVHHQKFLGCIGDFLGVKGKLWPTPSARVALKWVLQGAPTGARKVVLASSFNCAAVGSAVRAAGFLLETFDIASNTGQIDWQKVATRLNSNHRALIIPHLFGVPTDFRPILETCQRHGIFIIEDCAHTFGGRLDGQMAGSIADAAIFSFNYDKPLSLGWGGVLLMNDPKLATQFAPPEIETPSMAWEQEQMRLFTGYLAFRRRMIHRTHLLHRLWRRFRSSNKFTMPATGFGPLRSALGIWQLEHYDHVMAIRNQHANQIKTFAQGNHTWHVDPAVTPAWLKQKIMTHSPQYGLKAAKQLCRMGLRVNNYNWPKLLVGDVNETEKPYSQAVAQYSIDIPIHQNLQATEITTICRMMNGSKS
ncbi:MAG: DegT/DnrJ/EryC1/StrS family aminotransferase [Magnetococcus sp. DMHC-6]